MGNKKNNLFEMGAKIDSGWSSVSSTKTVSKIIKVQSEHLLSVRFEKRKGKPVTVVGDFFYGEKALKALHQKIKKSLACGGGVEQSGNSEGNVLLFQGDHREKVKPLIVKEGWKFKS